MIVCGLTSEILLGLLCRHKMGWGVQISMESPLAKTPLVSLCSPEEKGGQWDHSIYPWSMGLR